ncbi:MAG: phage protein Gp36 family protein [Bacteroidales bacterium]
MYITIDELNTVAESYQIYQMANQDEAIIQTCINAAIKRVAGYLGTNYDVEKIFTVEGDQRDPDILEITKSVALWNLCQRCNIDILYDKIREIYDRNIKYLEGLAQGKIYSDLPKREIDGKPATSIRCGSRNKFKYE